MSLPHIQAEGVSKVFSPRVHFTERIAARLGRASAPRSVYAVNDVTLTIARAEVLGLVGESGCGKSTLGRMISGILPATSGRVLLEGRPVMAGGSNRRPSKIDRRVQMVFQNPYASLNPRMRIGKAIAEGPVAHGLVSRKEAARYAAHWLTRVGLDPAYMSHYPHQFSGGQRQRIAVARALAMQPDVLVCDEPVASLDVSIQAQVINLFLALRREMALTMLFISHDLGVVKHICDRVAVMYLGRIVEVSPAPTLYANPRHPYTRGLLDSIPRLRLEEEAADFCPITGELPSPLAPPSGCAFHTRCALAEDRCSRVGPKLMPIAGGGYAACHVTASEELGSCAVAPFV